jgi:hypothetical protein
MDRLIRTAWRAFWVGLGASAVLISQSVFAPAPAPAAADPAPVVVPAPSPSPAAALPLPRKSADPILSRNPFDSRTGPLRHCVTAANITRCS